MASTKDISLAYDILRSYDGDNGYITYLKNRVYAYKDLTLNDFHVAFIVENKEFCPIFIGKIVKVAQWWGEKKQLDFGFEFTPKVIEIGWYMGQSKGLYVFYARFRKSQERGTLIICPKEAILTDFLLPDFNKLEIDFTPYNSFSGRILKPHQEQAVKFLVSRKKCILADEPGSGKSAACAVASLVGGFKNILIICPASIKPTWKRELMYYVPEDDISIIEGFNEMKKGELEKYLGYEEGKSGLKKEELLSLAKEKGKWTPKKYTIVNYDILDEFYNIPTENKIYYDKDVDENGNVINVVKEKTVVSRKKAVIQKAMDCSHMFQPNFDLIILDEAHKLSNMTSGRYKIIHDFIKRSNPKAVYCVTGTPITNCPYNFYNILRIIDAPITKDWKNFVLKYCDGKKVFLRGEKWKWTQVFLKERGKTWHELTEKDKEKLDEFLDKNAKYIWEHKGASNLDELKERVKSYYLRREQKDFGDIVNKTVNLLKYELSDSQRSEYEHVYNEFANKQEKSGNNVSLMIEGAVMRQWLSNEMIPYTKKLADKHISNGEKVIIICCFDDELYKLRDIYQDKCVIYNGKCSPKEKVKAEDEFMHNDDIKVFIGNIVACGVGLTLTAANTCIFNNFSWQSGENEQASDRIYRLSQTKDCTIYFQLFKNTFYEKMFEKVCDKENVINTILVNEVDK